MRLRPITRVIPKEMLPVGRKPVLQHVVEDLHAAGIFQVLFVLAPSGDKQIIRDYFGDGSDWNAQYDYAIQPERRGPGEAILRGEEWAQGEPFVIALPDCIIESPAGTPLRETPFLRLIDTFVAQRADVAVMTECLPFEKPGRFGVIVSHYPSAHPPADPFQLATGDMDPKPEAAPSKLVGAARWCCTARMFDYLRQAPPKPNGEVHFPPAARNLLADNGTVWVVPLREGEARYDTGVWDVYLSVAARAAINDPDCGAQVRSDLGI